MIFWQIFLNSIKLPNKQAIFALNRTGMDITIAYLMILLLFASIPSLSDQLTTGTGSTMNLLFFLIYFFIFFYLPLVLIVFLFISLVAYIGTGAARLLRRKVRFPMLWKVVAYSTTIPILVYIILSFLTSISDVLIGMFILYMFLLMIKIVTVYPKRKRRPEK